MPSVPTDRVLVKPEKRRADGEASIAVYADSDAVNVAPGLPGVAGSESSESEADGEGALQVDWEEHDV